MAETDHANFYQRAEAELDRARRATNAKVVAVHHQLGEAYLARLSSLTANPAIERSAS